RRPRVGAERRSPVWLSDARRARRFTRVLRDALRVVELGRWGGALAELSRMGRRFFRIPAAVSLVAAASVEPDERMVVRAFGDFFRGGPRDGGNMSAAAFIALTLVAFAAMEVVAALMHRFVMHGPL